VEREAVANDEHLALLRRGTAIWNEWRDRNPGIIPDLEGADLNGAELRNANLRDALLFEAKLSKADLSGADLSGANLRSAVLNDTRLLGAALITAVLAHTDLSSADLANADLSEANLAGASLYQTNFSGAFLYGANLSGASVFEAELTRSTLSRTIFGNLCLSDMIGLEHCVHVGPSIIDFHTLQKSGNLPLSFMRGCGLPDNVIHFLPSLREDAINFYSCFISYSARDQLFAERLHADLQNKGVRCWFAPHHLPIGAKTLDAIDEAIRLRDKLLVILSKASIESDWVEDEVNKAYAEERERKQTVLFPIRIDDAVMTTPEPWGRKLRDQRNIGDFRLWEKLAEYQNNLERLLRDLTASGTT
jgi:hypothetical protein